MKQSNVKRAVNLTVLVLAAGLLILLTGCPQTSNFEPQPDSFKPQTVTITVQGDDNVTVSEPKTLETAKGTTWSAIKAAVAEKISYKEGYEAAGFKLDSKNGVYLEDGYVFNTNKTVCALSKPQGNPGPEKITITVTGDDNVTVNDPKTVAVAKGTTWSAIKAAVAEKISYKEGYEAKGFTLDSESGQDLKDGDTFNEHKTVFAISKKYPGLTTLIFLKRMETVP